MSKAVKTKILIVFLVAVISLTPLAVLYSGVTALTDVAYINEEGNLDYSQEENIGMGYGNAFDMFGEVEVTTTVPQTTVSTTQSPTKQYEVAKEKNTVSPTEPGSKENISTTTPSTVAPATLSYNQVGKDQDVTGKKLSTLPPPSEASKNAQLSAGYLIAIRNPDPNYPYNGVSLDLTEKDIDIAGRLIMGEAGTMGFYGCCLVAQAIRDTYVMGNFKSIDAVRKGYGYDGSIKYKPNAAASKAVKYILQEGHSVVQHRLLYFYNPRLCQSRWHETRNYILTYKDVRFFDK